MNASAQTSLWDAPEPVDDPRTQLQRLPFEMRVWLDSRLDEGAELRFLADGDVERERLMAAASAGLRWQWVERHRGVRREWRRPASKHRDPLWLEVMGFVHVAYEPRMERELGVKGRQSEQRFYWPKVLR